MNSRTSDLVNERPTIDNANAKDRGQGGDGVTQKTATDKAGNSATKTVTYSVEAPAGTPVFSLKTGTYSGPQSVSMTDATPQATIYYTLDGSIPTTSSSQYNGSAITISSTTTLKADALAPGFARSAVRAATYTIQ